MILLLLLWIFHLPPQERWTVRIVGSFRVQVADGVSEENTARVLTELDHAHRFYREEWGLSLPSRVTVYVYGSTAAFRKRTRQRWYRAAYWDGYALHIPNPRVLRTRKQLSSTINHEVAHVAIQHIWRNRLPGWFEEGFAVYNSGEMPLLPQPRRRCPSLKEFMDSRPRLKSAHAEREWYATTGAFIFILVRQYGKESIKRLFTETDGLAFERTVRSVLHVPLSAVERNLLDEFNFRVRKKKFPY